MASSDDDSLNGLCIGDYITLNNTRYASFLSAEGIIRPDVTASDPKLGGDFDDHLFQIHLQRQYSAARELEMFMVNYHIDENAGKLDEATRQYLNALENGRNNEVALNNVYLTNKAGEPVFFGSVVQLFHIKSKKYICVDPKQLAANERENSRVYLSENGNIHSWFKLMPRYKIDREGDRILTGAEIYICMSERETEGLRCADVAPRPGYQREINNSLIASSFKLDIFQSHMAEKDKTLVFLSQLVHIFDPETRSNLAIASEPLESLDEPEAAPSAAETKEGASAEGGSVLEPSVGEESSQVEEKKKYFHDFGDIVIEPVPEGIPDSRTLWQLEGEHATSGGPILWRSAKTRFRNVNTSLYLLLKSRHEDEELSVDNCVITTTPDATLPGTLFSFLEPNGGKFLHCSKALSINHNGIWLERGKSTEGLSFEVKGSRNRNAALSLVVSPFSLQPKIEREDANSAPLDEHVALAGRKYLSFYLQMTVLPTSNSVSTLWPKAVRSDPAFFHGLIESLVYFSQGFPISREKVLLGVEAFDPILRTQRQRLLRELGPLEIVLRLIHKLIPITKMAESHTLKKMKVSEEEQVLMRMGSNILDRCFHFVYYCVLDCPDNQMYVADFIKVLLAHLGTQTIAGRCVTEMLSKNMELQETKIGQAEISIFVDKLRMSSMNSMYLNLLQSCCSCQGQGVDNNQCLVADLLFQDTNDIIIELHVDYTKAVFVSWNSESIYIPPKPIPGSPILGDVLLNKGLPQLSLAWTTNAIDCSPLGLFGKLSVNVFELYGHAVRAEKAKPIDLTKEKSLSMIKLEEKKLASLNQKNAIAEYFINEMFLGAEMCMDRNYVAMNKLDPYFSFESLVTMLKMEVNNKLKAGAARLLLCLHIDRDPQAETKIPCLTRVWTDTENNPTPSLPYVEPSRRYVYGIVQELISEHVRGMAGCKWDSYSKYMLELLFAMLKFNFYGTIERMHDVIDPIVTACDRRMMVVSDTVKSKSDSNEETDNIDNSRLEVDENEVGHAAEVDVSAPWQKHVLDFFESLPVMIFILSLVIVAVSITIYQVVAEVEEVAGSPLYVWGLIVFIIFVIDYTTRFYCHTFLTGKVSKFVCSPFNIIDILVIGLDVVFLALPPDIGGGSGNFTKTLRLVRLARLLRLARAAKVVSKVMKKIEDVDAWMMPSRYSKVPHSEIETLIQAQNILLFVQSVIQDRNLSLLLRGFYHWENGQDRRTPGEIFDSVSKESNDLTLGVADFDMIFIDMIMISNASIVQGVLDVVMAHHSKRQNLLENAKMAQILVAPKRERQFKIVDQMLQQLERNAETHELWGELQSDSDALTNKQTKDILMELTDICRVRRTVLEFDEEFYADESIQDLYRNLGCFTICFKMLGLLESVQEDENGELSEIALNTRDLCYLTNHLLYWFCLGNPRNQELAYGELEFFLESLDAEILSHTVIRAIFKGNETLMKLVPHSLLSAAADNISKNGKFHGYLALPISITHVGEKNLTKNQFEIMKAFAAPGKLDAVAAFLVSPSHPDYREKVELMAEVGGKYVEFEKLPSLLAYHFAFLEMLSNCTVGRINITSVEAKVQSIYAYEDVIKCILDPQTITLAKTRLGLHFFNSVVEVELSVLGLEKEICVWNLFQTFPDVLNEMFKHLQHIERAGWADNGFVRQRVEYGLVCIKIVNGFFGRYYDSNSLVDDPASSSVSNSPGVDFKLTLQTANNLVAQLWHPIFKMYEFRSPNLSTDHRSLLRDTLETLNKSAIQNFTDEVDRSYVDDLEGEAQELAKEESREIEIHKKWASFLKELDEDEEVQLKNSTEANGFIAHLEELPYISDPVVSDLRYETLIQRLVRHITGSITLVNGERRINARDTRTAIWVIKAFRTMIENKMGMTIFQRDEEGGEEQDEAAAPVVRALNENGAAGLCLDLIAIGIDEVLQNEAIKLIVGMLFKEGGARDVQGAIHHYLTSRPSDLFFRQVRQTIGKLITWHKWHGIIILEEGQEPSPPDDILLIRFLQLLSEGHYLPNQDLMREQPKNTVQVNLLDDFVLYLNCLSRLQCQTSTNCAIRVAATILEIIQGPSVRNQEHFSLNTDVLEVMNRVMRLKDINDCVPENEIELKKTTVDIYEAFLEGQATGSVVVERILSVIHIDIIEYLAKSPSDDTERPEGSQELQTECIVLMQILTDFNPKIRAEPDGLAPEHDDTTSSVEISWDGVLNRRFFHIPDVCSLVAKSSKDRLVSQVDRSNKENKLIDFLTRAHDLYREAKHQERLVQMGIAGVFSTENKDRATWMTFVLAWVQNSLFIAYYNVRNDNLTPQMPGSIEQVAFALNIVQVFFAAFTVVLTLVVRSPVIAWSLQENHPSMGWMQVALYTACDTMTLYYFIYLLLSILGTATDSYWVSLLLLDIIVKNETTAAVLDSVWGPRVQLAYSMLLGIFLFYIFAFYLFTYYQDDLSNGLDDERGYSPCSTLYSCCKFMINFGLQNGGGPADAQTHSDGSRLWYDLIYFVVMLVIWLNITFGIIIDTFSSLRAAKNERLADTTEICFICGIGRQTFDRASDQPDGFQTHLANDHNMWNYLNFIFFIWEQDKDDDDGLEYYVRQKIDDNEITWFPLNKAMRLELGESNHQVLQGKLKSSIEKTQVGLSNKLTELQSDVGAMLENLTTSLKEVLVPKDEGLNARQETEEELEWYPALGYNAFLAVKEIRGCALGEELKLLNLRIISDSGMYSVPSTGVDVANQTCIFNTENMLIAENAQPTEKSSFNVQVLLGSVMGASKFVAVVDITIAELLSHDTGSIIEKPFTRMGQVETCSMVLEINYEQARKFTKGVYEDED